MSSSIAFLLHTMCSLSQFHSQLMLWYEIVQGNDCIKTNLTMLLYWSQDGVLMLISEQWRSHPAQINHKLHPMMDSLCKTWKRKRWIDKVSSTKMQLKIKIQTYISLIWSKAKIKACENCFSLIQVFGFMVVCFTAC